MAYRCDITAERAQQLLRYNAQSGLLTWKVRTPDMFKANKMRSAEAECRKWNTRYAGKLAGTLSKRNGYIHITIDNLKYRGHRIAWLIEYGRWPTADLDHRTRRKNLNSTAELREVTGAENNQNLSVRRDNRSGHPGVSWRRKSSKWYAYINIGRKRISLGFFDDLEKAVFARAAAKKKYHPLSMEAQEP